MRNTPMLRWLSYIKWKCNLVVEPPLWTIWVRQLGLWHSQYMENHNPAMFQVLLAFYPISSWWTPDVYDTNYIECQWYHPTLQIQRSWRVCRWSPAPWRSAPAARPLRRRPPWRRCLGWPQRQPKWPLVMGESKEKVGFIWENYGKTWTILGQLWENMGTPSGKYGFICVLCFFMGMYEEKMW